MAYNSKYTGQEVENLLDKIDKYDLADMETQTHASSTYQLKGNYLGYSNVSAVVAGTSKTLSKTNPTALFVPSGLVMGGTATSAGLVTRGICGVMPPDANTGACTKDHLYINCDGTTTYNTSRQVVLQANNIGADYGNNLYQYCLVRGDVLKGYCENNFYTKQEIDDIIGDIELALSKL